MQVELIVLFLGGATLVVGSVLTLVGLATMQANRKPSRQSFLAPVLAIDALDADLRVAYSKTMVLDARSCAEEKTIEENGLGAEIRRLILAIQAARGRGQEVEIDLSACLEPIGDWCEHKEKVRVLRLQLKKENRPE